MFANYTYILYKPERTRGGLYKRTPSLKAITKKFRSHKSICYGSNGSATSKQVI